MSGLIDLYAVFSPSPVQWAVVMLVLLLLAFGRHTIGSWLVACGVVYVGAAMAEYLNAWAHVPYGRTSVHEALWLAPTVGGAFCARLFLPRVPHSSRLRLPVFVLVGGVIGGVLGVAIRISLSCNRFRGCYPHL